MKCGLSKCRSLFTGHVCLVSSDSGGGDGGTTLPALDKCVYGAADKE